MYAAECGIRERANFMESIAITDIKGIRIGNAQQKEAGTGKTWLAKALGKQAINAGLSTVYWHAATLIDRIKQARSDNEPIQFRNRLNAKKLLIIDDFGMTPMDEATRDDFFSFIDERGQAGGSLIIASQRGFDDWYSYIGDKYHADAILDRLKNRSYFIELKGQTLTAALRIQEREVART